MGIIVVRSILVLLVVSLCGLACADEPRATDSLYLEIGRTVSEVDFAGMAKVYHPDAVLVTVDSTTPISEVIGRWQIAGEKLAREGGTASVEFRFTSRIVNDVTGFETGVFKYSTVDKVGKQSNYYGYFENLSVKQNGKWLTLMERQEAPADKESWEGLAQ